MPLQAEALTRELQSGFKRANDEIKAMQAEPGAEDAQVRDQVQRQLGRALMVLTREFRGEETRYLNKVGVGSRAGQGEREGHRAARKGAAALGAR